MNIQARKLSFIEEFIRISDESVIEKLETLIRVEKQKQHDKALKAMPLSEFYDMIDRAKLDKENGRIISHHDLKKKVKS